MNILYVTEEPELPASERARIGHASRNVVIEVVALGAALARVRRDPPALVMVDAEGEEARELWRALEHDAPSVPLVEVRAARSLSVARLRRRVAQLEASRDAEGEGLTFRTQAAALSAAADAIMITDREGAIMWVNPAWEEMTGYSAAEALGQTPRILKSGVQDMAFYEEFWRTVLAGKPARGELVNRRKDGTLYHEYEVITPVLDASGAVTHFIAIKQDITERKQTEERLRALAQTYLRERDFNQAAIESLPGLFYLFDEELHFLRWNRNLETTSGYTAGEIAQMSPLDFFRGADREVIAARIREVFVTGEAVVEAGFVTKQGAVIPHFFTGRRFSSGDRPCLVGMGVDITARLQLEERLRHTQKMEAIGHLAGGVAHDFNNLLTVIQGNASALKRRLGDKAPDEVEEIIGAASRAGDLTRQLLAFGRRQAMQPAPIDLNEAVEGIAKMLQRILGEDVQLRVTLHGAPLLTRADEGMLGQVLMNLAVNARDAMPEGGELFVETSAYRVADGDAAWAGDATPGEYVHLRVTDTGSGIAPEHLARIFEPFFTTKGPGQGTGLGLATVFGIVKQHAGAIRVSSDLGRGTTFDVLVPMDAGAQTKAHEKADRGVRGGVERILIVEDDAPVLRLVQRVLERHGYRVHAVQSGDEARVAHESAPQPFALLLTDVVLPGAMTGRALAEHLRERQPNLKVVLMSGWAGDVEARSLQNHVTFLPKPFSPAALLECVRACLDAP